MNNNIIFLHVYIFKYSFKRKLQSNWLTCSDHKKNKNEKRIMPKKSWSKAYLYDLLISLQWYTVIKRQFFQNKFHKRRSGFLSIALNIHVLAHTTI